MDRAPACSREVNQIYLLSGCPPFDQHVISEEAVAGCGARRWSRLGCAPPIDGCCGRDGPVRSFTPSVYRTDGRFSWGIGRLGGGEKHVAPIGRCLEEEIWTLPLVCAEHLADVQIICWGMS